MNYLSLSGNKIKDGGASSLSNCIDKISVLRIAGCGITSTGMEKLADEVANLTANASVFIFYMHNSLHNLI